LRIEPPCARQRQIWAARSGAKQAAAVSKPNRHVSSSRDQFPPAQILPPTGFARGTIDHLFDRGFIGFEDSGRLIISPVAHLPSLQPMGVETQRAVNVGGFTEGQRRFLEDVLHLCRAGRVSPLRFQTAAVYTASPNS
jgi:hypothetical protein